MNVVASCNITLSKKLEKICSDSPIFLSSISIDKNKSSAKLKFGVKAGVSLEEIKKIGETSIIVKISDVVEESQDIGDGMPVGNLYTTDVSNFHEEKQPLASPKQKTQHTNVVNAIAITNPDKEIKKYKNIDKYIAVDLVSSYEELQKLLSAVPNIDAPIPQVSKKGLKPTREEAIEYEKQLLSVPRLHKGVYISNETGGRLCIDDLDIVLVGNEIFDLSRKPAKILLESSQFRVCCERGFIKFRSRGEYLNWADNALNNSLEGKSTLPVFDKATEAMDKFGEENVESKSSMFVEEKKFIKNPNKKSEKVAAKEDAEVIDLETEDQPSEAGEYEDVSVEEGLDILKNREIPVESELANLAKDLPTEKDESAVEVQQRKPLLSEEADKADKKSIRRIS